MVAVRSHLLSSPIDPSILNNLAAHFSAPIRFSACIIRFKDLSVILCTCYLWDSEGLTERNNNNMLMQIHMLMLILSLPIMSRGFQHYHSRVP